MIAEIVQIFQDVIVCPNMGGSDCPNNRDNLLHVVDLKTEVVAISLACNDCCDCPYLMAEGNLAWLKNLSAVIRGVK